MTMLRCCQKDEFDFMLCEMSTQMYIYICVWRTRI